MDDLRTSLLPREVIADFIKSPRGVRAIEDLQNDTTNLFDAVANASFLTLNAEPSLGAERVLTLTGDLSGTDGGAGAPYTLGLANTTVVAGTYGSASKVVAFTVNAKGRITAASEFTLNSDNVTEGATNLFFTNARARSALSGGTGISYDSGTGAIALDTSSNRNVDHSGVTLTAGAGLTGGGDITANRTFAVGAGTGITVNADDVALTVPTDSGTYTPTLTNVTNLDGSTAYSCQYLRVGSVVTVSGQVDIDATATGSVELGISLPIASNFANANECGGTAAADQVAGMAGPILADPANNRARLLFVTTDTSARGMFFSFAYRII